MANTHSNLHMGFARELARLDRLIGDLEVLCRAFPHSTAHGDALREAKTDRAEHNTKIGKLMIMRQS